MDLQTQQGKERMEQIESSTEIYISPCIKQMASRKLLSKTELSLVHCDDLEGWDGVGWKGNSGGRGYKYAHGRFPLLYGRNQQNITQPTNLQSIETNNIKIL